MATVNLCMRGGPYDGQTRTLDVIDANDPPELYSVNVHGPHEFTQTFDYRRIGRESDGAADGGTWIYEAPANPAGPRT